MSREKRLHKCWKLSQKVSNYFFTFFKDNYRFFVQIAKLSADHPVSNWWGQHCSPCRCTCQPRDPSSPHDIFFRLNEWLTFHSKTLELITLFVFMLIRDHHEIPILLCNFNSIMLSKIGIPY